GEAGEVLAGPRHRDLGDHGPRRGHHAHPALAVGLLREPQVAVGPGGDAERDAAPAARGELGDRARRGDEAHLAVDHVLGEPHVAVAAQRDGPGVDPVRGHREAGDRAVRWTRAHVRVQLADGVRRLRQLREPQLAVRAEEYAGRVDTTLRAADARTAGDVEGAGHA